MCHEFEAHDEQYRLHEMVSLDDDVLLSRQPLIATRLNAPAVDIVAALSSRTFRSPSNLATETGHGVDTVAELLDRLYRRGFLEWRPARDPTVRPPVSIVVTVRNDRERLLACLDALAALSYPTYEVIVVDDGSTDGTREAARTHAGIDSLRVVEVGTPAEPLGIGASRNRGVEAAVHGVVAFTDADCRPTEPWLAELVPCLAGADLVGGRIRPAGTGAASVYEGINSSLDMGPRAARVDPTGGTPYLATANLLGWAELFEAIPFPDRNIAEDVDVCWRAIEAGYDAVYTPTGIVEHNYRGAFSGMASRRSAYGASEALLAREYGRDGTDRVAVPVDVLGVVLLVAAAFVLGAAPVLVGAAPVLVLAGALGLAGALSLGGLAARLGAMSAQLRRSGPSVGVAALARSRLREVLSWTYAFARELTRYYSLPLGVAALSVWFLWSPPVGALLLGVLVVLAVVPAAVEYAVHRPPITPFAYLAYSLLDHLGYQRGVYRGSLTYRTLAHLDPRSRFVLSGPLAALFDRCRTFLADRSSIDGS